MKRMKVKIKDLKPNPFRDLDNYPFDKDKIEQLKKSIEQTGFWDNVTARRVKPEVYYGISDDGEIVGTFDESHNIIDTMAGGIPVRFDLNEDQGYEIQIAYGHHRLKALQEVYKPDFEIEVPIKELSDKLMLKIMANENMEEWHTGAAVIDETVRAVKKFLSLEIDFQAKAPQDPNYIGKDEIADFLDWPKGRVKNSLIRINAIEGKTEENEETGETKTISADKQAVETIKKSTAATLFASKVIHYKLTVKQQRKVANIIEESGNYSRENVINLILEEKYPKKKKDRKKEEQDKREKAKVEFEKYLLKIANNATVLKDEILGLSRFVDEIKNFELNDAEALPRKKLLLSIQGLSITIKNLLKELSNDEN